MTETFVPTISLSTHLDDLTAPNVADVLERSGIVTVKDWLKTDSEYLAHELAVQRVVTRPRVTEIDALLSEGGFLAEVHRRRLLHVVQYDFRYVLSKKDRKGKAPSVFHLMATVTINDPEVRAVCGQRFGAYAAGTNTAPRNRIECHKCWLVVRSMEPGETS